MRFGYLIMALLAMVLIFGSSQTNLAQSGQVRPAHSMKGYELYSWKSLGKWRFSLLVGTNRLKSKKEVTSPQARLDGLESLKRKLAHLPSGEEVSWSARFVPGMAMPPRRIIDEIASYCKGRGLTIRVSGPKG